MNDKNNDPLAGVFPIVFFLLVGVIYQKREYVLKTLEQLLHKLMWLSLYLGIAFLIGWVLYSLYNSVKKRILEFRQWIATVDAARAKHEERFDSHRNSINWLKSWNSSHQESIANLEAQIKELKTKFEPKKDVVQAEAAAKVEEAVQVVVEKTT